MTLVAEGVPFIGGVLDGKDLDVPLQSHGWPAERIYVGADLNLHPDEIGQNRPDDSQLYLRDKDQDMGDWQYRLF
jgi:hypothetical protein